MAIIHLKQAPYPKGVSTRELTIVRELLDFYNENFRQLDWLLNRGKLGPDNLDGSSIINMLSDVTFGGDCTHHCFDPWGIDPICIKWFPNKCVGSGFEWYNADNGKPFFWVTDGRVTEAANWEGTVALQLEVGQKLEQGTLYPIHAGTKAGADPAWWDHYQTRVSFKHKGGRVRVQVRPYPSQSWSWSEADEPRWVNPEDTKEGNFSFASCASGEVIALRAIAGRTALVQSYAEDLDTFLTVDHSLVGHTEIFEGSKAIRGTLFNHEGGLFMSMYRRRSPASGDKQQVLIYKSLSGNGRDEHGNPDWELYSTIRETQMEEDNVWGDHMDIGAPLVLPNGRWVMVYPYYWVWGQGLSSHYCAVATSDNGGKSWTHRHHFGHYMLKGLYSYRQSRNLAYYQGKIWWTGTGNVNGDKLYYSPDNGITWHYAYVIAFGGSTNTGSMSTLYVYNGYLWLISAGGTRGNGIYRTTNPMSDTAWECVTTAMPFISSAVSHPTMDCFMVYFSKEQERVWSVGHQVLGQKQVETGPYMLYDNSELGMTDEEGNDIATIYTGYHLDYEFVRNWAYMEEDPEDPEKHYLITGYHTFFFFPRPGDGKVKICFENIDLEGRVCFIDAVQIEPDFTGKWPAFYTAGPRSMSPTDVIGMPGLETLSKGLVDEGSIGGFKPDEGIAPLPREHAETHAIEGEDPITPLSIGAADRDHTHPSTEVGFYRESFVNKQVWEVQHNKGDSILLSIWKGTLHFYDFGLQKFGLSPFGGGEYHTDFVLSTHEPIITEVDKNNVKITWGSATSGKVVCLG